MPRLLPGDEKEKVACDWCHSDVDVEDITVTNDESEICPDCTKHYNSNI